MIIVLLLTNIRLPYYVNAPGGIIDISNRIEYKDKKEYKGSLNMLYVTEYIATIPTYLMTYVLDNWDLEKIENSQISNETPEEINDRIEYKEKKEYDGSLNMLYVTERVATLPTYLMSYILPNWDLESIKNSLGSGVAPILQADQIAVSNTFTSNRSISSVPFNDTNNAQITKEPTSKTVYVFGVSENQSTGYMYQQNLSTDKTTKRNKILNTIAVIFGWLGASMWLIASINEYTSLFRTSSEVAALVFSLIVVVLMVLISINKLKKYRKILSAIMLAFSVFTINVFNITAAILFLCIKKSE